MYEFVGAVHVHSIYSDGTGKVEDIAEFAAETGLDFVLLTDHNTMRARNEGKEKWYGKTALLVGVEINDKRNLNHYLAFGIDEPPTTRIPAKEYVKVVKEAGGIGFLAHPHEKRTSFKEHPAYPWTEWDASDSTGMEIWNHMSQWAEGLTEQNKFNYFIHPLRSVKSPPKKTIKEWDKLNMSRKVVGIGGVDAHAHKVNLLGFYEVEVFAYKVLFKSVRTHILSEKNIFERNKGKNIEEVKKILFNSMREGKCFVSNYYLGDAKGFMFYGQDRNKTFNMGDSVKFNPRMKLHVYLPSEKKEIRFVKNGKKIKKIEEKKAELKIEEPGIYRVEVFHNKLPWIYSNHIRIEE
jgi:hypothetical protein